MPTIELVVSTPVERSFRVDQVAGIFDLDVVAKSQAEFCCEVPSLDDQWTIGVIVGPSGSGKSTVARHAFGDAVEADSPWPETSAVVDGFGDRPIKEIVGVLNSVGFSSPPSWVKPFRVLSNGEQFRCNLARALLADKPLVVFDEFTSVVDRTVAKIGSAAVAKSVRSGRLNKRFVAVTCHYDVVEWLSPDWVLDMASSRLARRRLRRPDIQLEITPIHRSAWVLFRRHHYLATSLMTAATAGRCFAAFVDGEPAAFSAWVHAMTRGRRSGDMREHRTVVLPDYQGVGIGNRLSEFCASIWTGLGGRAFSTTSHPAMIHHRSRSPVWLRRRLGMASKPGMSGVMSQNRTPYFGSVGRITGGFQYVGPAMDRDQAERLVAARPSPLLVGEPIKTGRPTRRRPAGSRVRGKGSRARVGRTRRSA